jgi:hypothetical protein
MHLMDVENMPTTSERATGPTLAEPAEGPEICLKV